MIGKLAVEVAKPPALTKKALAIAFQSVHILTLCHQTIAPSKAYLHKSMRSTLKSYNNITILPMSGAISNHSRQFFSSIFTVDNPHPTPAQTSSPEYYCDICKHASKVPLFYCSVCNSMHADGGTHKVSSSTNRRSNDRPTMNATNEDSNCGHNSNDSCPVCDSPFTRVRDEGDTTTPRGCDYFDFFKFPHRFNMDEQQLQQLTKRYRDLQMVLHPDAFSGKAGTTADDLKCAADQSAAIADAYRTLKNPYQRALYLLKLNGVDLERLSDDQLSILIQKSNEKYTTNINKEYVKQQEQQLLMEVLEIRENLDVTESLEDLKHILGTSKSDITGCLQDMEEYFGKGDLLRARHETIRLNYLSKIQAEVESKLEKLTSL